MAEVQKTDDVVQNSSTTTSGRLEEQMVSGVHGTVVIDKRYEIWGDGVYRRKQWVPLPEEELDEDGVARPSLLKDCPKAARGRLEQVTGRPIWLSALGTRDDDGREIIGISYRLHDDTETVWLTYDQIAIQQELQKLSQIAMPVRSSNATRLSDYLTDCFDANHKLGQAKTIVRRLGYHHVNKRHGWVVAGDDGPRWIGGPDVVVERDPSSLSNALHTKGSLKAWCDYTRSQWNINDRSWFVRWAQSVAFAAPLVGLLGQRTFTVHHTGQSGGGKSTIAFLAQSAWGHPKDFSLSLTRVTQNAATEIFRHISGLPLLLDETEGSEVSLSDFIYQAASERHKVRVKSEGGIHLNPAKDWSTVIRTTGERFIAGASNADLGGQRNRVLEVDFTPDPQQSLDIWTNWLSKAPDYGHAGTLFCSRLYQLLDRVENHKSLEERYKNLRDDIAVALGAKEPSSQERFLGVIALAEYLMLYWLYDYEKERAIDIAREDAIRIATMHIRGLDGPTNLLELGLDALEQHRAQFAQTYVDLNDEAGRMKLAKYGTRSSLPITAVIDEKRGEIWYLPDAIDKYLEAKFNSKPARFWHEMAQSGYVVKSEKQRKLKANRQDKALGFKASVYVVKLDTFNEVVEEEPAVTEEALEFERYDEMYDEDYAENDFYIPDI